MVKIGNKNVFLEALIITLFIFGLGILFGIFLENSRTNRVSDMYSESEINLFDIKVQTEILNLKNLDCKTAVQSNIDFGNKIYEDAQILDEYEKSNKITNLLVEQHKKYDLLRTLFWINSIKIKENCNSSFHTLVYVYNYDEKRLEEKSKQAVFSKFLEETKGKKGDKILLIPIAENMGLMSTKMMLDKYYINGTAIIIDEKTVITSIEDLQKINDLIK